MNFKQQLFNKNRIAMVRAFENPDSTFSGRFLRVSAWFQQSTLLSKKNIERGNFYIVKLREEAKDDVEKQVLLDRLDELRLKALERLKRREEKRAKLEAEGVIRPRRSKKNSKPAPSESAQNTAPTAHLWVPVHEEK